MTEMSGLITPDHTFSDFNDSFYDSQPVVAHSPSLLYSELWGLVTDELSSRDDALSSPKHGGQPALWFKTKIDGSASELYAEPVDSDLRDDPLYSRADDPIAEVHDARKTEHLKPEVHGPSLSSVTDLHHICPERLNHDIVNVSGVTPPPSLEGNRTQRAAVPRCECHGLLKRPISAPLEPGKILKIYRLYSRQMRNAQLTTLRHLQDKFETLWQKVRQAAPSLQSQVQQTLGPILDTPPTITDGLITLSLLSDRKPPRSLHEYISLVFFAKAWLSLGEQQGIAEVAYGLFIETARCASVIPSSNAERDAYNILLQLLWQPFAATMSPPETHPLFCPAPSQMNTSTSTHSPRTTDVGPKWVLSHVCRDIVDGKINTTAITV